MLVGLTEGAITKQLCYQFICNSPLTELPQNTCGYCDTISAIFLILGVIFIAIFVFGLAKDIVKGLEQKPKSK